MLSYHFWFNALWIAHPVLEAAVAASMWRRKAQRTFPYFFAYVLAQIVIFGLQYPIYTWGSEQIFQKYFSYIFWGSTLISMTLAFKVLHEIFLDVFRPFHTLKDMGNVLFRWAALVMLLVGVVVAVSNADGWSSIAQAMVLVQRCLRLAQVGLVLFLLLFSSYLGISRRQHSFGVALGFGVFAGSELILWAMMITRAGLLSGQALNLLNMGIWNTGLAVWFAYFLAPDPVRATSAVQLRPQRWDHTLGELHQTVPADSLIPMFESMVERALSKSSSDHEVIGSEVPVKSLVANASSLK